MPASREQPLGARRRLNGVSKHADALAAGAAGAPAAMLKRLDVVRQIGVDDEAEIGQVDAARGDVGRHQHARAAVAQRLQGLVALVLAQFARQRHGGEAALRQRGAADGAPPRGCCRTPWRSGDRRSAAR